MMGKHKINMSLCRLDHQCGTQVNAVTVSRCHEKCCVQWFCSVLNLNLGLHETLALLTSQLRPDSNHKEEMGFLRDVFSERSLSYLMKVKVYISLFSYLCTFSLQFTLLCSLDLSTFTLPSFFFLRILYQPKHMCA